MKLWWLERKFWFVCNLTEVLIRITRIALKFKWIRVAKYIVDKAKRGNELEKEIYGLWRKEAGLDNTT